MIPPPPVLLLRIEVRPETGVSALVFVSADTLLFGVFLALGPKT